MGNCWSSIMPISRAREFDASSLLASASSVKWSALGMTIITVAGRSFHSRGTTDTIATMKRRLLNIARCRYLTALGNTPGHLQQFSRRSFLELLDRRFELVEVRSPLPWTMVWGRSRSA